MLSWLVAPDDEASLPVTSTIWRPAGGGVTSAAAKPATRPRTRSCQTRYPGPGPGAAADVTLARDVELQRAGEMCLCTAPEPARHSCSVLNLNPPNPLRPPSGAIEVDGGIHKNSLT